MDTGQAHERAVLAAFRDSGHDLTEIQAPDFDRAHALTLEAINARRRLIYQAALQLGPFAGYADFLELHPSRATAPRTPSSPARPSPTTSSSSAATRRCWRPLPAACRSASPSS